MTMNEINEAIAKLEVLSHEAMRQRYQAEKYMDYLTHKGAIGMPFNNARDVWYKWHYAYEQYQNEIIDLSWKRTNLIIN